jgi:hypothetical protein
VYILGMSYCYLLVVCLNVNTDCLAFHTGTLAALAHYLSFALLVVGLPLR